MPKLAAPGKFATMSMADEIPPTPAATWQLLEEVYEIGDIVLNRPFYDDTTHNSSLYRTGIAGIFDAVEIPVSLNYESVKYDAFRNRLEGVNTSNWFRFSLPQTGSVVQSYDFEAIVRSITISSPIDERETYSLVLAVIGDIVFND